MKFALLDWNGTVLRDDGLALDAATISQLLRVAYDKRGWPGLPWGELQRDPLWQAACLCHAGAPIGGRGLYERDGITYHVLSTARGVMVREVEGGLSNAAHGIDD